MRIPAKSEQANEAKFLLSGLQVYFVSKLNALALEFGKGKSCNATMWERNRGKSGGGVRYEARDVTVFNRASVNISQIHYEDDRSKSLDTATAFCTTIHPANPHVPTMHLYVSWRQEKGKKGYWDLIADLSPSILNESTLDQKIFSETLKKATGELYEKGRVNGNTYFYIPELKRHRGVSHYYLENHNSGNFEEDKTFVLAFCESIMNCYISIFSAKLTLKASVTEENKEEQLAYHTLYLFHVLTQERETILGVLEHHQNDLGILASLPSYVNRDILSAWIEKMTAPQVILFYTLLKILSNEVPTPVNENVKKSFARALRKHYTKYPEALNK